MKLKLGLPAPALPRHAVRKRRKNNVVLSMSLLLRGQCHLLVGSCPRKNIDLGDMNTLKVSPWGTLFMEYYFFTSPPKG